MRWYDWLDLGEPLAWFDEGLAGFVTALVLIMLLVVAALFVLPVFVFLVEILIVALVLLIVIALRVVFRRPWLVDAVAVEEPTRRLTWKVVGASRAKKVVDAVAQQLSSGIRVPQMPEAQFVE